MSIISDSAPEIAREIKENIDEIYDCFRSISNGKEAKHWATAHGEQLRAEVDTLFSVFLALEREHYETLIAYHTLQHENEAFKQTLEFDNIRIESDHE